MIHVLGFVMFCVAIGYGNCTWSETCENIDNRLPCSTPELVTTYSEGSALGTFIGEVNGDAIQSFYNSSAGCPIFSEIYGISPTFSRFVESWMTAHAAVFPSEHNELISMAAAANVSASDAFIQNTCSELYLLFGADVEVSVRPQPVMPPPLHAPYLYDNDHGADERTEQDGAVVRGEHCSDIGIIYRTIDDMGAESIHTVQGHNEDWWSTVADMMSIVQTPDWWGYMYPGQLAGTSFIVNNNGLSLSMNSLYPTVPGYSCDSLPKHQGISYAFSYSLRSIINATTTDEVVHGLSKFPIFSGYSLNVMSACDQSVANIEGYGDRLTVQRRREVGSVVGHYNNYINSLVPQEGTGTSDARRTCQLATEFNDVWDVRKFLGDLKCPIFFTDTNGQHQSETLATWVADATAKECSMHRLPYDCNTEHSRCDQSVWSYQWNYSCEV